MRTLLLLSVVLATTGCSVSHLVNKEIKNSSVLSQQHTGLAVSRLGEQKELASYQGDKYFNPASNTKLFSFYAGLNALGDSIPGLQYLEWGELLIIRGTGDPSLLHPDLPHSRVYDFLKSRKEPIFYTPSHYDEKMYGPGWAWSDYNDYYQVERSPLPIYGNIARFSGGENGSLKVQPNFWRPFFKSDTTVTGIQRERFANVFHHSAWGVPSGLIQDVPVITSDSLTVRMLSDTLGKDIKLIHVPLSIELETVYSIPSDSLYYRMMQVSDNMLAEQLMLLYATQKGLPLNTQGAINHAVENYMGDLPDRPVWRDGSGLSRYNLFTPRTIVALLQKIHAKVPSERLYTLLPNGGQSGTLKSLFKDQKPFVFAKTGSLSNNYCLSGYLITRKGKTLVFSFMNNNYTESTASVRKEVERILTKIHDKY
ncbi:D-alanyl-D-alanine carboxypeptidase/D-alanyl-D-alanine-endopeptidase (penicillin-binding protein 4) [Dyadobacter jejuensis]|uniref:D-alanyl-D-alanine carboxypeptidase/D-alanyl-D-alanine-endopeptidase (Penicillin-binding protein 4) n=1 Tax=Dyadobacter jejuensis TaxID=1082580 RepID=A0A316A9R7_9BACT|nr:D-alanyl-D-alanine carboxypeptidase [Dyadobacter jejuensis]PWJ53740.1 D-alanyl-D-alanine carboxypeptidase/D-alanyl-D-alanine-endopeptidase (penicillin-binding protein 4) [Dyadobacter jejuensis]